MKLFENIPLMRSIPQNPAKFVLEALYGVRKWAVIGALLAFLLQLMKVFVPVFFSDLIDYFSFVLPGTFSWHKVWWLLGAIFASYLAQSLFRMIRELVEENKVRNFMDAKIKLFAVDYLAKHSENYFASQKTGELAQKVSNCAFEARNVHQLISRLYSHTFLVLIDFFFIARVSFWFLALVLVFSLISIIAAYRASFKVRDLNKIFSNTLDDFNGTLADSIGNALSIKSSGAEEYEVGYVKNAFQKVKSTRLDELNAMQDNLRFQNVMLCFFEVLILLLMLKMWYQKQITIGEVTLVLMLVNNVMSSFSGILANFCDLNSSFGALQAAMLPFLKKHEIEDAPNAKKLKLKKGAIEFKDVCFSYGSQKVFKNLSFEIKGGEKVGIVGVSGSGKTTLINLLCRAYDIQKGQILIDGQDIKNVTQQSLREAIALIAQDTSLFHRTISQNIAYGDLRAPFVKIKQAAVRAYADKFIQSFKAGFATKVGEKGVKLSGGERQRICISRAILKNSPILILDEATSALDSKTEKSIQKAMKNLMRNKTVIAVAHRLSTLKEMDKIIVLDQGKIIEQGKIEELLSKGGIFKNLWKIQN